MPLWDWLRKRPPYDARPDKIWLDDEAALSGLAMTAGKQLDSGTIVVVVAHFADVLEALQVALESVYGQCVIVDRPLQGGDLKKLTAKGRNRLLLAPAELLVLDQNKTPRAGEAPPLNVAILVRERHPLRSYDERIEQFAASLPAATSLEFHVALDDPLVQFFHGAWASQVLSAMGMHPDESIESTMVLRKIRATQLKIERRTTSLEPAHVSARNSREWLEKNTM